MKYNNQQIGALQKKLRKKILELSFNKNTGHIACSLSCIDILISILILYKKKDDFILSKGHSALALYVVLNYLNKISDSMLESFYNNGTKLPAHPAPNLIDSIPFATGSLGHGLPLATGMALANKINKKNKKVIVLMSDGETNGGTLWEASHFAVSNELNNLVVIIDNNKLQGFGRTKEVIGDTAEINKLRKIGYETYSCCGHNPKQILKVFKKIERSKSKLPKIIIADTIKGKGVKFMEDKMEWHYLPLNEELFSIAMEEL